MSTQQSKMLSLNIHTQIQILTGFPVEKCTCVHVLQETKRRLVDAH